MAQANSRLLCISPPQYLCRQLNTTAEADCSTARRRKNFRRKELMLRFVPSRGKKTSTNMILAVAVTMLLWVGAVEGDPWFATTTDPVWPKPPGMPDCPALITVPSDGRCRFVNPGVRDKIRARLNRRQIIIERQVCPYCAQGVYDAFPNWDDCTQFNYCLNGIVIPLKCRDLGGVVFNPVLKACEMFQTPGNVCTNRTVALLQLQG